MSSENSSSSKPKLALTLPDLDAQQLVLVQTTVPLFMPLLLQVAHRAGEPLVVRVPFDVAVRCDQQVLVRDEAGVYVPTTGQRVLDFTSGQICSTLGHNHPRIAAAVQANPEMNDVALWFGIALLRTTDDATAT